MINIKYKVEFFDAWHTGSGLAAGADVDALVIKDKNKLPYLPGKTIKGLVREALEEIIQYKGINKAELVKENFGVFEVNGKDPEETIMLRGKVFFTNAYLSKELSYAIKTDENLYRFMYRSVSSTAIEEKTGVAKEHSLRRIQISIPCELYGEVLNVDSELENEIVNALGFIKRLGVGRNRGLGRCKFTVIGKEVSK